MGSDRNVAGQPVPTGINYDELKTCLSDAASFASLDPKTVGKTVGDSRMSRVLAPEYACIPNKGDKP